MRIIRFCGCTPASSVVSSLLLSIIQQVAVYRWHQLIRLISSYGPRTKTTFTPLFIIWLNHILPTDDFVHLKDTIRPLDALLFSIFGVSRYIKEYYSLLDFLVFFYIRLNTCFESCVSICISPVSVGSGQFSVGLQRLHK